MKRGKRDATVRAHELFAEVTDTIREAARIRRTAAARSRTSGVPASTAWVRSSRPEERRPDPHHPPSDHPDLARLSGSFRGVCAGPK